MSKVNRKGSGLNKIVSIDLCQNIGLYGTSNNFFASYKKKDKKKQIELKSKIDIQMSYNTKETNKFKSNLSNKRLGAYTPIVSFKMPEDENVRALGHSLSKFKLKNKSNFSDSNRNLSSLETSEKEEEEENITFNSNSNVRMFSTFGEANSTERKDENNNKSLSKFYNEYSSKCQNNLTEGSLEKTIKNINYSKETNEDIVTNMFNDNNYLTDKIAYINLLENYKTLKLQFDEITENCCEYKKVIEILKEMLLSQNNLMIEHVSKENLLIKDLNKKVESLQNKSLYKVNLNLKSILVVMHNKITDFENLREDQNKTQEKYVYQLLKENEYLRMCNNTKIDKLYHENNDSQSYNISENKRPKTELKILESNTNIEGYEENNNSNKLYVNASEKTEINNHNIQTEDTFELKEILSDYKNLKKGKTKLKSPQPLNYALIMKEDTDSNLPDSSNYMSRKLDISQTNIKPRQQYLFFKTPKESEKKRFDFTEENINYMFTAN